MQLDTDKTVGTFDPRPYWTGFHAQNYGIIVASYTPLASLLTQLLGQFSGAHSPLYPFDLWMGRHPPYS